MTNKEQKEMHRIHIQRTLESLNITRKEYRSFLMIGNKLHRFYEMNCDGYYGTEEQYTKDTEPLYKKAEQLAKEKGLKIFFQTDPRGATIYLDIKEIPDNNYTNAFVIY